MAKPKKEFIIEKITERMLYLHCLSPRMIVRTITDIAGVKSVFTSKNQISIYTSPLFDINDIIEEIEQFFSPAPVAKKFIVFKSEAGYLRLYCSSFDSAVKIVTGVEGVNSVVRTGDFFSISVSPLFDTDDVLKEIKQLLSQESYEGL